HVRFDSDEGTLSLKVDDIQIEKKLSSGEQLSWEIGDGFGGPEPRVECSRDGKRTKTEIQAINCKGVVVMPGYPVGTQPSVNYLRSKKMDLNRSEELTWSFERGRDSYTIAPSFARTTNRFSIWMGEYSEHVVDVINATVSKGDVLTIRKSNGAGYEDLLCRVE
ncbi:MAG: hypothetical protein KDD25_09590, partial [Bdellovibrionales bacterium]|nr:hypothetical protein [Bdellovibrionales bacterium]